MEYSVVHLKDHFPFLGENGKDPFVEIISPTNMDIDKCREAKRPCLIVVPGGGYTRTSPREAEPLALDFLSLGYHTFILKYTPGPEHNFPTQLREVAALVELIHLRSDECLYDADRIAIMGFSANKALNVAKYDLLISSRNINSAIIIGLVFAAVVISQLPEKKKQMV